VVVEKSPLSGKILYVPRMDYGFAKLCAAAFRALGINARICPQAGEASREKALKYVAGDECYPKRVTLADFFEALALNEHNPGNAALMMPTAAGPCRFGQYAFLLKQIMVKAGHADVTVLSPTSETGYRELAEHATAIKRLLWWAAVISDALRRMLHRTRPYELNTGTTDIVFEACLDKMCGALESREPADGKKVLKLAALLKACRDDFEAVAADRSQNKLLIGVVGEIFCRLSAFSNEDLIRRIEGLGGEAQLSGIAEWLWYVNATEKMDLKRYGKRFSKHMLSVRIAEWIQGRDEKKLMAPIESMFEGVEEPHDVVEVLELARPYLPWDGALGEMVLSVGKAICLQKKGADAIADISPFTCMNGVVSEAVYPQVSRENGGIPIKSFIFDGSPNNSSGDLEIFMELAANYRLKRLGKAA